MTDLEAEWLGKPTHTLPTPCFLINESKFNRNCSRMLSNIDELRRETKTNILFRAHIKTHKTAQGTFRQLGYGLSDVNKPGTSILVSTIKEAEGILSYQESLNEKRITDVCYSLPACMPDVLTRLNELTTRVEHLRVFVDHPDHLKNLVSFGLPRGNSKWLFFIKIDMGTHRAGLDYTSKEFSRLLNYAFKPEVMDVAELCGFYAHAGHSYSSETINDSYDLLLKEIDAVNQAAKEALKINPTIGRRLILSVGATPTINSLRISNRRRLIDKIQNDTLGILEIHCGNYCLYDLQQLSTNIISNHEIAGTVLTTVISSYSQRNEELIDAGVLSLTRESSRYAGHGLCISLKDFSSERSLDIDWYVDRVSQEHGIIKKKSSSKEFINLGEKLAILPQHACIVMAQFPHYFIIDDEGKVKDIWIPSRGW